MKLKFSLISVLVCASIIPLVIGFTFLVSFVSDSYKLQVANSLDAITQIARNRILSSVDRIKDNTALVASRTQLRKSLLAYQQSPSESHLVLISKIIKDAEASISNISEITVYDGLGNPVVSTLNALPAKLNILNKALPFISLEQNDNSTLLIGFDNLMLDGAKIGIIKLSVEPNFISEIVDTGSELGESGEWMVAIKDENGDALLVSATKDNNDDAFSRTIASARSELPISLALAGHETIVWDTLDYAGNTVVAATRYIPEYKWGVVAKINQEEVLENVTELASVFWLVLLSVSALTGLLGWFFSQRLASPIENLTQQILTIQQNPGKQLELKTSIVEVEYLSESFNKLLFTVNELNRSLNEKVQRRTQELANSNEKLLIEKQNADAASKAKSSFLANMSHELRTPLNSIHGTLQILARQTLPEKSTVLVKSAGYSMVSLLKIINDILDFSKIEEHAIELEHIPFNFVDTLENVVSELTVMASTKDILLDYKLGKKYQEGWVGDPLRIKQVLVNFISNAIKFTDRGSVTIWVNSEYEKNTSILVIKVIDTGSGMSKEVLKKLFDRFSQADSSTTRKFGGTGLGMSISLGIVNLMRGEIKVDSEIGKGTQIVTRLPLEKITGDALPSTPLLTSLAPDLSGKTILLAEDNEINQLIFCSMLEETHATVLVAGNGEEALGLYEKHAPDIVFLDIQMPVMDGVEACKFIRAQSKDVPLISITANISLEDTDYYSTVGFDFHVGKPVELHDLYRLLSRFE